MDSKSKIDTEPYKGVRDFYPEDMAIQNYIFGVWRKIALKEGYVEYGASILEPAELYRAKSGDEIVNDQMFLFKDKGDRDVALRPEMTPTLARMIAAKRKALKFPLRWFSIPNLFRYERPQRGRKREHWQLNCDLVGLEGEEGDVEIISLAYKIMKAFGAKDENFEIKISSIDIIEKHLRKEGVDIHKIGEVRRMIDKREKLDDFDERLTNLVGHKINLDMKPDEKIEGIIQKLDLSNISFNSRLSRGFDYYTGMIFEVFDTNPENKRSLFGGGRYDNLLEIFGVEPVPTVGFGMGDITIRDFLETHKLPLCEK